MSKTGSNTITVYVPRETSAVSLGADNVADRIAGLDNVRLVRNGSWGATWLEPLVEVAVDDQRIAYGVAKRDEIKHQRHRSSD